MKCNRSIFNEKHEFFTQNRRISPRQIRRAMTLEIFGISSLLLPPYLAKNGGISGVVALLVGAAGALGLLCVWEHAGKWADQGNHGFVCAGKVLCGVGLLAFSACVLALLASLMRDQLLSDRYEIMILLTLSGAGFFGLWKGLESRIRIYEVLFWFLIIPLVVILIVASVSVTPAYWCMAATSVGGFVKSCLVSFLFFALSSLVLLFRPHCSEPERAVKSVRVGVIVAAALNVAIYLILLGVFQQKLLANLEFPVILLMAVVKLPGEFFERQDALMAGIWFFCLFALFDSLLFYGKELLCGGICQKENRRAGKDPDEQCQRDDIAEDIENESADGNFTQNHNGKNDSRMNSDRQNSMESGAEFADKNKIQKEKVYGILWSAACTLAVFVATLVWRL